MTGSVEHESLVDVAEALNFSLCHPELGLKLFPDGVEVAKVACRTVEQRDFAGLLVRRRKGLLEACVTVSELIATTLLGLDALLADSLATIVSVSTSGKRGGLEILVVVLIGVIVTPQATSPPVGTPDASAGGGGHDRIETVRPGNGRSVRERSGGRVGTTATAGPARGGWHTIGGELASREGVATKSGW